METDNGHLVNCDTWMKIHLREVICTSKDGDRFWRMPECYIRGNTIKYLRVLDELICGVWVYVAKLTMTCLDSELENIENRVEKLKEVSAVPSNNAGN
uniref:U6 snRNA-associated Sm-like protein LSm4 n=1 Tax=Solanum tuberosum TaxID=4113 RepID=M1AC65_SOLTU